MELNQTLPTGSRTCSETPSPQMIFEPQRMEGRKEGYATTTLPLNRDSKLAGSDGIEPPTCGPNGRRSFSELTPQNWLRGLDLNQRPLRYERSELPSCSTPQYLKN